MCVMYMAVWHVRNTYVYNIHVENAYSICNYTDVSTLCTHMHIHTYVPTYVRTYVLCMLPLYCIRAYVHTCVL